MSKSKLALVVLLLIPFSQAAFAEEGESSTPSSYTEGTKVPEPMTFDMAGHLDSPAGEMEVNTLFRFEGASQAKNLYLAPEFEYVFARGMAAEIEVPILDGEVEAFKVVLQSRLGEIKPDKFKTGVQLIYEQDRATTNKDISALLINSVPFGNRYALTTLIGPSAQLEESETKWGFLANASIHYTNSHEIDLALEANYKHYDELKMLELLPQIHLMVEKNVKVQFGFGATLIDDEWIALSAIRAAWEFNG